MKAILLAKENGEAKFTIDFTAEELEAAKVEAYKKTKDQFQIDGFRKGKAPRKMIENKYGDVFAEDAINDLIAEHYPKALLELDIESIEQPRLEFGKLEKDAPFSITATVATYPEVTVKDYKGIELEKVDDKVTAKDVNAELEGLQKRNARMVAVDRKVKKGDHIILDYKGFVGDDQFEGGTAEGYPLVIGSGSFIPGFEDQLVGAEKEKEVDVKVTFPTEYHAPDLAGKEAVFKCVVHEVKEEELPELDDEFAKDVSEYDTFDELKKETKKDLKKRKTAWAQNQMKDRALEIVCDKNDIDVPKAMVYDEVNQMINEISMSLSQQGLSIDQYVQFLGKNMEDFQKELEAEATKRVKMRMVVRAIADAENIVASDEDIEKQLELMAIQYSIEKDQIRNMLGEASVELIGQDVKLRKAIDFIFDNATIKEPEEKKAAKKDDKEEK